MSAKKCSRVVPTDACGSSSKQMRRQVRKETFLKWQRSYEKEHQSLAWLRTDMDTKDKSLVSTLWCVVYRKFEKQVTGQKNFSKAWVEGSINPIMLPVTSTS